MRLEVTMVAEAAGLMLQELFQFLPEVIFLYMLVEPVELMAVDGFHLQKHKGKIPFLGVI